MLKGLIIQASHTETLETALTASGLPWRKVPGGSGEVLLINENGEAEVSQAISGEVLSVSAAGKYIAVLTTESLILYTDDLKEYSTTENNGSKRAIINSDGATMMIGTDSTRLYVP